MKEAKLRQLLVLKQTLYKEVADIVRVNILTGSPRLCRLPGKKHRYFLMNECFSDRE